MSTPRKRKAAEPPSRPIATSAKKAKASNPHLNNLSGKEFVSAISNFRKSSDVVITVKGEAFTLPKQLLCDFSPFFDRAFNGDFKEAKEQKLELVATDVTSFQHVIRWMYLGSAAVPAPLEINQYVGFFLLADMLDLQGSFESDLNSLKSALRCDRTKLSAEHIRSAQNLPKGHVLRTLFA